MLWGFLLSLLSSVYALPLPSSGTSRQLLARPPGHETLGAKCEYISDVTTGFFGLGTLEFGKYYADNQTCTWQYTVPSGQSATLMFHMFHLEKNFDYVDVYRDSVLVEKLTGELIVPYGIVLRPGRIEVRFHADETYHIGPINVLQSLQIGFNASFKLSAVDECPFECGTGNCTSGKCVCGDRLGADCSVYATKLVVGAPKTVENLPIGKWAYFVVQLEPTDNALIEVDDFGSPDSDAMLAMSTVAIPTLSSVQTADWFDWYYDASDIHVLRMNARGQQAKFYIGLTNHIGRAEAVLNAKITLRTQTDGFPCILDCAGHGTCSRGSCVCDANATGYHMNSQVCNYPFEHVSTSSFPYYDNVTVRVGDWKYYKFTVNPSEVSEDTSLLVSLWSKSPRSRPILLVKKNSPPSLVWGYVPTYGAFIHDFGDEKGFDMLTGMQQNVLISAPNFTAGDWYVGVYDIWGYTGVEVVSHDSASVDLYFNIFQAGKPCPRAKDDFCAGNPCDFNTGKCLCPIHKLGSACAFDAVELTDGVRVRATVPIGMSHYYVLNVTRESRQKGPNFELVMTKTLKDDKSYPFLLARFEELPFSENYTEWDDHDLTAHYYHEQTHSILLDRDELKVGLWYFSITNTQDSEADCTYDLVGNFKDAVACPEMGEPPCSQKGVCREDRGRCECSAGSTMDDCSAQGVFPLAANTNAADTPPIPVDSWAYWVIMVGCQNSTVEVRFTQTIPQGQTHEAAPLLVMRQNKLPLMVEGTNDYFDYFRGTKDHAPGQAIAVWPCEGNEQMASCVITPMSYGSNWSTGYIKPGIWYVGLYNDFLTADGPISRYSLHYTLNTPTCTTCAKGFMSPPACNKACPGMIASNAYTNAPFESGEACSGRGECMPDASGNPKCKCEPLFHGDACEEHCPGLRIHNGTAVVCAGRGTCVFPKCECDVGYEGSDCSIHCPGAKETGQECSGQGTCSLNDEGDSVCQCSAGFAGEDCSKQCPDKCSGNGVCQLVYVVGARDGQAQCECHDGFLGKKCEKKCPGAGGVNGTCSGQGECALNAAQEPKCTCYHGFTGAQCQGIVSAPEPTAPTSSSNTGLAVGLTILALVLAAGVAYLVWVARKQKAALERYRLPILDGAVPTSDESEAQRPDQSQELQPMGASSDGPVDVI